MVLDELVLRIEVRGPSGRPHKWVDGASAASIKKPGQLVAARAGGGGVSAALP